MEPLHIFLGRFPPFQGRTEPVLEALASASRELEVEQGTTVLVEDGPPSRFLYVVRSGAVALQHEGETVDVLGVGEVFGHPSLLTGLAPSFTVRAHEPATLVCIPKREALEILTGPGSAGFVAQTLRERLTQAGHTVHGLPQLQTIAVSELIPGPPLFCEGSAAISRAAADMTEANRSALLVQSGELLIVTDADIRARVVAGGLSAENPVLRIAQPAVIVEPTRLAIEVVIDMLGSGVDHVAVVDRRGTVHGVVSAADLMGMESRSPFAVRHGILRARDEDELVGAAARLRELFVSLLGAGLGAPEIGRVLALQLDTITGRLLDFAFEREGRPSVPWAWLTFGSAARRELTLGSDQEHGVAYAGPQDEEVDAMFARVGASVTAALLRCGFKRDANAVLASERLWRMPISEWENTLAACLTKPDRSHLIRATIAFDFRHVAGGLDITSPLVEQIRAAASHPDFIRRIARTATDFKPPLGFRGAIVTGRDDDAPPGTIDIKRGGMLPVVNIARFHAIANQVTISATLDRLIAVEELGALSRDDATALREALAICWRTRLEHHAGRIAAGVAVDDYVDPDRLAPLQRGDLREAFRAIARAQKQLALYQPLGKG
jgi:CBS domain-containing protein